MAALELTMAGDAIEPDDMWMLLLASLPLLLVDCLVVGSGAVAGARLRVNMWVRGARQMLVDAGDWRGC